MKKKTQNRYHFRYPLQVFSLFSHPRQPPDHIDPGEYRRRRRLDRVMELILQSDLTLKEIAAEVGMAHVTHLYALLGTRFTETPAELVRHYREARQK